MWGVHSYWILVAMGVVILVGVGVQDSLQEIRRERLVDGAVVTVTVARCAICCCGRPWAMREGEQTLTGRIALREGGFLLYAQGAGTLSYVAAVELDDVLAVAGV